MATAWEAHNTAGAPMSKSPRLRLNRRRSSHAADELRAVRLAEERAVLRKGVRLNHKR